MLKSHLFLAAIAAVALAATLQTADAGCGGNRYVSHRTIIHRPVHTTVVHRPIIHRPVVVHKPVVVAQPTVVHQPIAAPACPQVPAGSKLTLPANFLGPHPGHVFLSVQGTKLPAQIINWTNNSVTFQLPPMAVVKPLHATIDILLPHGQLAKSTRILLTAPPQLFVHDNGPQAPLPTLGGPAPAAPAPQGNDILLPTRPATPPATAAPAPSGQAGIPFAPQPQAGPAPFTVLPPQGGPTGASASLLDAINDK